MSTATISKSDILAHLSRFNAQRSGIDFRNYGARESFMGDYRPILRAGRDARAMIRYIELRDSITADILWGAFRAFSGRLAITEQGCEYVTGQYFPTEYRNAVCAVLAQAIWDWLRASCKDGLAIRKAARRELGRSIANRWFN